MTDHKELAKIFLENNIRLIDNFDFVTLFWKATRYCQLGTIDFIKKYLDEANINYKPALEEEFLNNLRDIIEVVYENRGPEARPLPLIDFLEQYLESNLGFELSEMINLVNANTNRLRITIDDAEDAAGYIVPTIVKR